MKKISFFIIAILLGLSTQAIAQGEHKLSIFVGYPPGANYDLHARVLARHISKHLPASTAVVVQNMPGAGSLKAANFIYNNAPKDGWTIGLFARGMAAQPILDPNGVAFDPRKFSWIGSPSSEASVVFASAGRPFKTLDDVKRREMILAASGSGSDSVIFPYILNGVLGTKFKVVTGYPGSADLLLAVERGEADGNAGTSWGNLFANRPDWIRDKKIVLLAQLGTRPHKDLPNVPFIMDMATNDDDRRIFELIFSRQTAAYPFAAPPDVPKAQLEILRKAFDATMKDKDYLADAKRSSLEIDPTSGEEIDAIVASLFNTPDAVITRTKKVLRDGEAATVQR